MYYLVTLTDIAFVPPDQIGEDPKKIAEQYLRSKYLGKYVSGAGLIVDIVGIEDVSLGKVFISSPDVYFKAKFKALSFLPKVQEIIEGEIDKIVTHGAIVKVGPVDGFIHISQLGDDVFIQRGGVLQGRKTKITYRPGDRIRARVTAVSKPDPTAPKRGEPIIRIALSCRQPGLGKIVEEEKKEEEKGAKA